MTKMEGTAPMRNPASKYFVPSELWPDSKGNYPKYYSGAGYIINNFAMNKLIKQRYSLTNFPIDDARIGQIFEETGENATMSSSLNLCIGLTTAIHYSGIDVWVKHPCIAAAYAVLHKFTAEEMVQTFTRLYHHPLNCSGFDHIDFKGAAGKYVEGDYGSDQYKEYTRDGMQKFLKNMKTSVETTVINTNV